jgi:hypothetical protein
VLKVLLPVRVIQALKPAETWVTPNVATVTPLLVTNMVPVLARLLAVEAAEQADLWQIWTALTITTFRERKWAKSRRDTGA